MKSSSIICSESEECLRKEVSKWNDFFKDEKNYSIKPSDIKVQKNGFHVNTSKLEIIINGVKTTDFSSVPMKMEVIDKSNLSILLTYIASENDVHKLYIKHANIPSVKFYVKEKDTSKKEFEMEGKSGAVNIKSFLALIPELSETFKSIDKLMYIIIDEAKKKNYELFCDV